MDELDPTDTTPRTGGSGFRGLTRRQVLLRAAAGGLALSAAGILAACGDDDSTAASTAGGSTSSGGTVTKLGFSHPFPGTDIYRPLQKGLKEEAEKRGIQVLESQAEGKADRQLAEIRTWINTGVQGIAILNIAGEGLGPLVKQAHDRGVVIVGYASPIAGEDGRATFDNRQGADLVAAEAKKYIDANLANEERIEVGLLTLDSLGETGIVRVHGAFDALKKLDPRVVEVASAEGTNIAGPAQTATRSMMQAHPNIKMLICISDDGQVGAYQALKALGKEKDVWLAGYDGSRVAMRLLLDREMIGCTAAIPLREVGRSVVWVPANIIEGKTPTSYDAPYKLVSNDTPDLARQLIADFA